MPEIVRMEETVVINDLDGADDLATLYRDAGVLAHVERLPFGHKLPTTWPAELISVGGSVSVEFVKTAIATARGFWPFLKYVHLDVDLKNHFLNPEQFDYSVGVGYFSKSIEDYKCQPWTDEDFQKLATIERVSDFHYFIRQFYDKPGKIQRSPPTVLKYVGGIHDGQVLTMPYPAKVCVKIGMGSLCHIRRQGDNAVDLYEPTVVDEYVVEFRYVQTVRPPK